MRVFAVFSCRRSLALLVLSALLACAGCESPGWVRSLNDAFTTEPRRASSQDEEKHRREYSTTHSRESMSWLLAHCVTPGMSYMEVCRALGEEGSPEANDRWIKTRGTTYQVGDDTYAFGPDSAGQSVYLVFREDRLIGFEPDEFRRKLPKSAR